MSEGYKPLEELRIVLVGKTGVGKSAAANTILGTEVFESDLSSSSMTKECGKARSEVDGRDVSVIDTPGLFDTDQSNDKIIDEIVQCISLSSPGPHVFLTVIQLGRFTSEEQQTVNIIQTIFGEESSKYTVALFTHGDQLKKKSLKQFLNENKTLAEFTAKCQGGYHVFNNEDKNRSQVLELLKKIDNMVKGNGGGNYTNEMYIMTQNAIEEKKKKILEEQAWARRKKEEERKRHLEGKPTNNYMKKCEQMERLAREEKERCTERYNRDLRQQVEIKRKYCTIL